MKPGIVDAPSGTMCVLCFSQQHEPESLTTCTQVAIHFILRFIWRYKRLGVDESLKNLKSFIHPKMDTPCARLDEIYKYLSTLALSR